MALAEQRETTDGISLAMPRDYFTLMKPRVMSLVVFTALVGLLVAPVSYDADIDAVMSRTAGRPIPAGRVAPGEALAFGLVLAAFSVAMLGLLVNPLAAALLAFTIFFYAVVYTMWLKRSTPQNIVIGGAAGAFPPMIGWAAASGSLGLEPIILFAIIFLWTPPHFWALALVKRADYARAGIPMMPNVAGPRSTKNQILAYAVALAAVGLLPWATGFAGPTYGLLAALLGAEFVRRSFAVWRMDAADPAMVPARRLFAFSIVYLFALFATLLAEAALGGLVGGA